MNNPRTVFQVDGLPNQINIGRMTEKGVREIGFDVTSWMAHWPTMEISVWVTAPKPSTTGAYLANITREGNVITWHVNDADTAIAGNGTVEVCGITPDKKKLSASAITVIEKTTTHRTGPAPEPGEDYISRVLAAEDAAQGFANAAEASAERAENVNLHPAYINESDKHWYSYDSEEGLYVDTGVVAEGEKGEAGYSPEVTITAITGGHTVKITDEDHPDGQTFNVMDGEDGEAPIDDTTPAVNKVYSSQKVSSELTSLNQAIEYDSMFLDRYSANAGYVVPERYKGWYLTSTGIVNHGAEQTLFRFAIEPKIYTLNFNSYTTRRYGFTRGGDIAHGTQLNDFVFTNTGTTFTIDNTANGYKYIYVYGSDNDSTKIDIDLFENKVNGNVIDARTEEWTMGSIGTGGSLGQLIDSTSRCRSPFFYVGENHFSVVCKNRVSNNAGKISVIEYDAKMNAKAGTANISGYIRTRDDTRFIRVVSRNIANTDFTKADIPTVIEDISITVDCDDYRLIDKIYYCGTDCGLNFVDCLKEIENYDDDHKEVRVMPGTYDILSQLGGTTFLSSITQDDTAYTIDQPWIKLGKTKIIGLGNVILEYLPSFSVANQYPLACNLISVINVHGNVVIENIKIDAQYCRYCIHDETSGDAAYSYTQKVYKFCIMTHNAKLDGQIGGQCIGGGCDNGQKIIIDSCRIENENGSNAVSWHNRDGVGGCVFDFVNTDFITSGTNSVRFGNVLKRPMNQVTMCNCYFNKSIYLNPESGDNNSWISFQLYLMCCNNVSITIDSRLDHNSADPIVRNTIQ